jgi:hypothetical protein
LTLVHFINRHNLHSSHYKDCEFSRTTGDELWRAGESDVRVAMMRPGLSQAIDPGHAIRIYKESR